jgi:hypothetical protein
MTGALSRSDALPFVSGVPGVACIFVSAALTKEIAGFGDLSGPFFTLFLFFNLLMLLVLSLLSHLKLFKCVVLSHFPTVMYDPWL